MISFLLLVIAIFLATYFKSIEKKLEIEQNQAQNERLILNQTE